MLNAINVMSGVPTELLDDAEKLSLGQVRAFFESRILGQKEAVEAVVDLITLIKAGLTNPGKPLGVFLFVGPTGVCKTELVKTMAEYIFASPER
ncbi:MAG: ATP-dependent Clp protease ATP-binding subunit, partial [Planctomycetes bacterium]|nr:ATP-dependent Clp protease ATP-binding subunit [Planctomycetota bacterium]